MEELIVGDYEFLVSISEQDEISDMKVVMNEFTSTFDNPYRKIYDDDFERDHILILCRKRT